MGPPMNTSPLNEVGLPGTVSPESILMSRQRMEWESRKVARYPGPSAGKCLNMATGFIRIFNLAGEASGRRACPGQGGKSGKTDGKAKVAKRGWQREVRESRNRTHPIQSGTEAQCDLRG